MFRTIILRGNVAREIFRKTVRTKIVRNISIECAKKRHCHRSTLFGGNQNQLKWNQEENLRFYSSNLPKHLKVPLPALSPTMDTGTLISWEKKEGDKLNEGDLLAEIETDKATMGFETPEEGYLAKIIVPGGTKDVPLGKLICIIVENKEDVAAFKDFKDDSPVAAPKAKGAPAPAAAPPAPAAPVASPPEPQSAPVDGSLMAKRLAERKNLRQQAASPSPEPASSSGSRVYASPLARRLAAEKNIPLEGKGTGLHGSITSADLPAQAAAAAAKVSAGVPSAYVDIPVTNMRAVIAKRLLESKTTVPHYYLNVQVNVDQLLQVRSRFNKKLEKSGVKLSLNDFVIKAVAMASIKVPEANSAWLGTTIRQYKNVDVSVAVSTERGLITPIVFEADKKGIVEISKTVKLLAAKARDGKLQPQEFQGGTISVSNLGMFGVDAFAAIINPPQSCILAVGTTNKALVPDSDSEKGFKVSEFLSVTLSSDHRTVDGAVGAQWLKAFKECLEDPVSMII